MIHTLPPDAFSNVASFLLGIDLFHLSHTNQRLRELVDSDDSDETIWRPRVSDTYEPVKHTASATTSFKERYMRGRSVRFCGTEQPHEDEWTWSCARDPSLHHLGTYGGGAFCFDSWFSLLPGSESVYEGGILLGAQSQAFHDRRYPYFHQQFAVVDANRNLYCSMMESKPVIAENLDVGRWYHLALAFDGQCQRVYVDGELVSTQRGAMHREAPRLGHMQVGTGCITAGTACFPTWGFCGWYGFHGLVDAFRTWPRTLTTNEIEKLSSGEVVVDLEPQFCLQRADALCGHAARVRCSRPRERVCTLHCPSNT